MAGFPRSSKRRQWADIVAIIAGVATLGLGLYGLPIAVDEPPTGQRTDIAWVWLSYFGGGALAIAAVIVAQKRPQVGRILLGMGALVLLSSVFTVARDSIGAWVSVLLPAIAMLVAAPFLGVMPEAEREAPGTRSTPFGERQR